MLRSIKIAWSLVLAIHMIAFFGISQANFIWEDGKQASLEKEKRMAKGYRLYLKNMPIEVNF